MAHARLLGSIWQGLLSAFDWAFTRPGHRRFVEWITALALTVEEQTITGSVTALGRPADGKALERFAATGAGPTDAVPRILTRLIEAAPGRVGHGSHVAAVDDTKVHRNRTNVWGTCTFHEDTARGPNRARTVRAPKGVLLGAVLRTDDRPAWSLPIAGRLAFRPSPWPQCPAIPGATEPFQTTCERAVEWLRQQARTTGGRPLAICDGGSALARVVRPRVRPEDGAPRSGPLTRLRHDARWHAPRPERHRPNPEGGRKLPPPRQGGGWTRPWPEGTAFVSVRRRTIRGKEVVGRGRVSGPEGPVQAVVATVEGDTKRVTPVTSAVEVTGLQVVEWFAARFRQEDGSRDLKPQLGWEACRAGTRTPIERTSQAQGVTMSLLRLVQFPLEARGQREWWERPPWDPQKERPSVLEVERWLRRPRPEILHLLSEWLRDEEEAA